MILIIRIKNVQIEKYEDCRIKKKRKWSKKILKEVVKEKLQNILIKILIANQR